MADGAELPWPDFVHATCYVSGIQGNAVWTSGPPDVPCISRTCSDKSSRLLASAVGLVHCPLSTSSTSEAIFIILLIIPLDQNKTF